MFLQGDCFEILSQRFQGRGDQAVIFASPPWGGPGYKDDAVFNLETMEPYALGKLYESFTRITPNVALYLPRSSNLNQVARYGKDGQELQVMHYCVDGASKVSFRLNILQCPYCQLTMQALCVYYGNFLRLP